jgi:hypothetical protein
MMSSVPIVSALVRPLHNPALSVAVPFEGRMRDFDPARCQLGVIFDALSARRHFRSSPEIRQSPALQYLTR